jgi:hypothetical protein
MMVLVFRRAACQRIGPANVGCLSRWPQTSAEPSEHVVGHFDESAEKPSSSSAAGNSEPRRIGDTENPTVSVDCETPRQLQAKAASSPTSPGRCVSRSAPLGRPPRAAHSGTFATMPSHEGTSGEARRCGRRYSRDSVWHGQWRAPRPRPPTARRHGPATCCSSSPTTSTPCSAATAIRLRRRRTSTGSRPAACGSTAPTARSRSAAQAATRCSPGSIPTPPASSPTRRCFGRRSPRTQASPSSSVGKAASRPASASSTTTTCPRASARPATTTPPHGRPPSTPPAWTISRKNRRSSR